MKVPRGPRQRTAEFAALELILRDTSKGDPIDYLATAERLLETSN